MEILLLFVEAALVVLPVLFFGVCVFVCVWRWVMAVTRASWRLAAAGLLLQYEQNGESSA